MNIVACLTAILALASFGISAWLVRRFSRPSSRFYLLDHPNERSLHALPTPRTGGIAILAGFYSSALISASILQEDVARVLWVATASLLVAGVSFLDDLRTVPPVTRLGAHFVAALVLIFGFQWDSVAGIVADPVSGLATVAALFGIAWMVNLYNFMDGMDGFAGGMGLVGFATLAVFGWFGGDLVFALLNILVAAACAGFLLFNFPPARIFMGDVGSSSIGLLAAAFALWGVMDGLFPLWAPLLVFSPFIVDATATLSRRLLSGEKVWVAHKTHYYQRLVRLGWGHRRTVLAEYLIMLGCSASALWAVREVPETQGVILGTWGVIYIILMVAVARLEMRLRTDEPGT